MISFYKNRNENFKFFKIIIHEKLKNAITIVRHLSTYHQQNVQVFAQAASSRIPLMIQEIAISRIVKAMSAGPAKPIRRTSL